MVEVTDLVREFLFIRVGCDCDSGRVGLVGWAWSVGFVIGSGGMEREMYVIWSGGVGGSSD